MKDNGARGRLMRVRLPDFAPGCRMPRQMEPLLTALRTESRPNSRFTGRRVHFIGIGGCGMSGLARMLLDCGAIVTGSEPKPGSATFELARRGARISRDQVGELLSRTPDARSERLVFRVPHELARYIAHKGSVCIDGVSLTVNEVSGDTFGVNIIPHTAERTTLHEYRPGRKVNIEVDVVSRYLERLLEGRGEGTESLTLDKLAKAGFANKPGR